MNEQVNMINVEEIMKSIKEKFGETNDSSVNHEEVRPSFSEMKEIKETEMPIAQSDMIVQLNNEVAFLKVHQINPYYTELGKGIKGFTKRVVRKLIKPIILPMSERQNLFNEHVGNAIDAARVIELQHEERLNVYCQQIRDLETRLSMATSQIKEYQSQIHYLSEKNEEMSRALTIYRWRLFDHLGIETDIKEKT